MRKAAELPRPYLLSSNLPSVPARLAIDRLRRGLAVEDRVEFGAHLGQRIRLIARLCGVGNQIIKLIVRSEVHTSELQSLMRISYAIFCLKTNQQITTE